MTGSRWTLWAAGALLCAAIALVSYRYLLNVGPFPQMILDNSYRLPWLVIHVAASATALLLGMLQFLPSIRTTRPHVHRWTGRIYATGCLVGAIAGLVLAFGASTGPISTAGFGLLAVVWALTTGLAWRAAWRRKFGEHRAWMIRSFALTCAAVTLRLYLPALDLLSIPFIPGYRAISFVCWVPNLLLAELYLFAERSSQQQRRQAKLGAGTA
jgi:uncharacterized membrane protein